MGMGIPEPLPSLAQAARLIGARSLSPVELTQTCLDRIAAFDGQLKSFILVDAEGAIEAARAAEHEIMAGRWCGPLHGIPIALKDNYDTAGIRTTAGSRLHADRVPQEDAAAWSRLRAAGAILLGKLEMHEFAFGGPAEDALFQPPSNPWDRLRYAGGSSGGAGVAVAAGLCMAAMGTDTNGSIRIPAAHCGVAGLKPTFGLVSRRGVVPLSWSLDHCGPMARTAEDCALMLEASAGFDRGDPASVHRQIGRWGSDRSSLTDLRIGVVRFADGEPAIAPAVERACSAAIEVLRGLGATIVGVTLPSLWDFTAVSITISTAEAFAMHANGLRNRPECYNSFTRARFGLGSYLSAADYIEAQRLRRELSDACTATLSRVDLLACPAATDTAPLRTAMDPYYYLDAPMITSPFSAVGLPAISICCGFDETGLPIGLQLAARAFDDGTILRAADVYERSTPWRDRRPTMPTVN